MSANNPKYNIKNTRYQDSFTLIEVLVVIAILAVLSIVTVIALDPFGFAKQARDGRRLSELQVINTALGVYQTGGGIYLGSSNTVYVSVPDSSATCANLGLPTLPSNWFYHCAPSSTLTKVDGTGWISVDFTSGSYGPGLEKLPIDPINTTSSYNYYTYIPGGSWKLQAILESDKYQSAARNDGGTSPQGFEIGNDLSLASNVFPSYWVKVPGNSNYGTSDFWVMKYEAKCVQASNNTPLTSPDTGYHTYSNSGTACTGSSYYIASAPTGYPIANIDHNTALTYCASLGAHLLRNDEWMTIARNAEQVNGNWSGNSPGSGYLYSGHNDSAPYLALIADPNDLNSYYGETNIGGNQKRTLALSNGSVIWDLAGNVWEHVQRSVNNVGDLTTSMALPACSGGGGWNWCQFTNISAWSSDVAQAKVGPSNTGWNSTQGVGQVYTYGTGANQGTTVFLRGGSWDDGANAGLFTLFLIWNTGSTDSTVGFRCAR